MTAKQLLIGCVLAGTVWTAASPRLVKAAFDVNINPYTPPGLSGYIGYTFEVVPVTDTSNPVTSVLGSFESVSMTSPAMYQLNPPNPFDMGMPLDTVDIQNNSLLVFLTDANAPFQDSQFKIDLSGTLELTRFEDEQQMAAPIMSLDGATAGLATTKGPGPFDVAQIVVPFGATVTWVIQITQSLGDLQTESGTFTAAIPEASQIMAGILVTASTLGVCAIRRRANRKLPALRGTQSIRDLI